MRMRSGVIFFHGFGRVRVRLSREVQIKKSRLMVLGLNPPMRGLLLRYGRFWNAKNKPPTPIGLHWYSTGTTPVQYPLSNTVVSRNLCLSSVLLHHRHHTNL
ncbi:hypothetical protein HOY80DRAFT_648610 [Tuber brumale]|nr:hypothetical protein HOY80DRAFT_648610 [Tuber brumale]